MIAVMMTGVVIAVIMTGVMFADKVISVNVTAVKVISVMVVMIAVLNDVMMAVKVNAVVKLISVMVMTAALMDVVIAVKVMALKVISVKAIVIAVIVTGEFCEGVSERARAPLDSFTTESGFKYNFLQLFHTSRIAFPTQAHIHFLYYCTNKPLVHNPP